MEFDTITLSVAFRALSLRLYILLIGSAIALTVLLFFYYLEPGQMGLLLSVTYALELGVVFTIVLWVKLSRDLLTNGYKGQWWANVPAPSVAVLAEDLSNGGRYFVPTVQIILVVVLLGAGNAAVTWATGWASGTWWAHLTQVAQSFLLLPLGLWAPIRWRGIARRDCVDRWVYRISSGNGAA